MKVFKIITWQMCEIFVHDWNSEKKGMHGHQYKRISPKQRFLEILDSFVANPDLFIFIF